MLLIPGEELEDWAGGPAGLSRGVARDAGEGSFQGGSSRGPTLRSGREPNGSLPKGRWAG